MPSPVDPVPLWAPFPLAKRLNRNALTVAAALAGVTVLTVIVVTKPARTPAGAVNGPVVAPGDIAPPVPARPAFLDQPPRIAPTESRHQSATLVGGVLAGLRGSEPGGSGGPMSALPVPPPMPGGVGGGAAAYSPADANVPAGPADGVAVGAPATGATGPSARAQAYQAALMSSVFVGDAGRGVAVGGTAAASSAGRDVGTVGGGAAGLVSPHGDDTQPGRLSAPLLPTAMPGTPAATASGGGAPTMPVSSPSAVSEASDPAVAVSPDSPGSAYTVRAGTVIPGLLLTGINSDLPGAVLGQTSRDVFDSRTEQLLLVPKGSRLIGAYDSRSAATGRLIVTWTRLILPDGRSLSLPHLAATDERGQAGLHDQVNHHYGRVYGAALLTSIITAGVQLSQPQQSALYAAPSSRQVAAGAVGQSLGDVSLESARRGLDVPPTLTIRPGQPFNVFLASDVVFDGPYVAAAIAIAR